LVIAEFALALSLLAGAGLAVHSFWNLALTDPGFSRRPRHHILSSCPAQEALSPEQMIAFYRNLLEKSGNPVPV